MAGNHASPNPVRKVYFTKDYEDGGGNLTVELHGFYHLAPSRLLLHMNNYSWCEKGGSNMICSQNYCGIYPFSEAESTVIKNVIALRHFIGYISVRSYGKKILFPWAMRDRPTINVKEHIKVSIEVAAAIYKVDKHLFKSGSVSRAGRENGAGMAVDWAYNQGVVHSYILETRGEGIGAYFLEPHQILIAVREICAGLLEFARIM